MKLMIKGSVTTFTYDEDTFTTDLTHMIANKANARRGNESSLGTRVIILHNSS